MLCAAPTVVALPAPLSRAPPSTQPEREIIADPVAAFGCDPSYLNARLAPPPDLDRGDVVVRRFTVLPPDPHRFDGDFDGIGCERD